jgi:integrase
MKREKTYSKVLDIFSLTGITTAVFLDTRRVKDSLLFPVKFRVYNSDKRVYYPSGVDISEEDWKKLLNKTKTGKQLTRDRELIQIGFTKLKNHIIEMVKEEGFSFQGLDARLKRKKQNSIISEFLTKIESLEEEGRPGTASAYRCAMNSIAKFTKIDLKFGDITPDWLRKYERYLLDQDRTMTTVGMYLRCLRSIINSGRSFITPAQYPFGDPKHGKYRIKKGSGRKLALTMPQINKILKYESPSEEGRKYRDLWYFSFLCNGINVNDLLKLKYSDIVNGEIHFTRGKTVNTNPDQEPIKATILPAMEQIIKQYGNSDRSGYIFPFLTDGMTPTQIRIRVQDVTHRINLRMKKIGEALGLGNITTYSSRHSFASILKHNNVSMAFISESLGHTDMATTKAYLSSFDQDERAKVAEIFNK